MSKVYDTFSGIVNDILTSKTYIDNHALYIVDYELFNTEFQHLIKYLDTCKGKHAKRLMGEYHELFQGIGIQNSLIQPIQRAPPHWQGTLTPLVKVMFVSKDDLDRAIKAFEKINDNGKRYASKQGLKDYKIEQIGRLEREAYATTKHHSVVRLLQVADRLRKSRSP